MPTDDRSTPLGKRLTAGCCGLFHEPIQEKMKESEKDIELFVHATATGCGGTSRKFKSPQHSGVPDRLVLLPGGFAFFIECKSTGEPTTSLQDAEIRTLRDLGFLVFVCESKREVMEAFHKAAMLQRARS